MEKNTVDILLRIENTLGRYDSILKAILEDTKDIRVEAKYTNGKVIQLRKDVLDLQEEQEALYQAIDDIKKADVIVESPNEVNKVSVQKNSILTLSWEKIVFILGSVATLIAFIIEKL